jgi:hypothetical protein
MTEPLTRPLFDNRLLRATGAPDLALPLGQGLGAAFQMPTLGELATRETVIRPETFTEDQAFALRQAERERVIQLRSLEGQLQFAATDREREDLTAEIERLTQQRQEQLQSATRDNIEAGRVQAPEVLTEKYKDLGLRFDYAMSNEQAEVIADQRRAEMIREAIMSRSPSGLIPTVAYFGAGLAAMATDPLEVATMFIPVVGEARAAAIIGRLGRVGGRVAVGAIEGGVGQAITEPLVYGLSRQAQLDYDMSDSLLSVGLGVAFGSAIGGVAGLMARRAPEALPAREYTEPSFSRETAEIAIRQFANDQPVDISRFLDGRDLRTTTTLSRVDGIEFQARAPSATWMPQIPPQFRPSYLASEAGEVLRFDTVQKADAFAERNGGTVIRDGNIYTVRQAAEGDFVRRPTGEPLEFPTKRAADKFLEAWSAKPETASVVQLTAPNGRKRFLVSRDLSPREIEQITAKSSRSEIPQGINTRAPRRIENADELLSGAVRGVMKSPMADREIAATLAENAMRDPLADPVASRAVDDMGDVAIEDEIAEYEAMVSQIELSEEQAMELAAADADQQRASAFVETARAAALCVART